MNWKKAFRLLLLAAWVSAPLSAHEGVHRGAELDAAEPVPNNAIVRPRWLSDGTLWVSKQVQHILALRTEIAGTQEGTRLETFAGEVVASADAATQLSAPQSGTLERAPAGWPLVGERVQPGEILAWLRPLSLNRDTARRRARVADLDQKIAIAQLNMDRIGLQNQANDGKVVAGNIYYEQAFADLQALQEQRRLTAGGLFERLPVISPASGRVASISGIPGNAVSAGQVLFQLLDDGRLRVAATVFDPRLKDHLVAALLEAPDGRTNALHYRATEALADRPGWRILFDADPVGGPTPFSLGEAVSVRLQVLTGRASYAAACVDAGARKASVIWVHVAPERFEPRSAAACGGSLPIAEDARIVVAGADLLSRY